GFRRPGFRLDQGQLLAELLQLLLPEDDALIAQDECAVSMFATAIRQKLQRSRDKGRGGWIDCDEDILINGFAEHALKGNENNLLDLATFLMFMW
ncbi:hypothetical protein, partial [Staphylococcus aureus]|uniref:hypothetical protein n=1 Tax=Staphylococcus aureus TaxID=1280 RepID=UPI001C2E16FA